MEKREGARDNSTRLVSMTHFSTHHSLSSPLNCLNHHLHRHHLQLFTMENFQVGPFLAELTQLSFRAAFPFSLPSCGPGNDWQDLTFLPFFPSLFSYLFSTPSSLLPLPISQCPYFLTTCPLLSAPFLEEQPPSLPSPSTPSSHGPESLPFLGVRDAGSEGLVSVDPTYLDHTPPSSMGISTSSPIASYSTSLPEISKNDDQLQGGKLGDQTAFVSKVSSFRSPSVGCPSSSEADTTHLPTRSSALAYRQSLRVRATLLLVSRWEVAPSWGRIHRTWETFQLSSRSLLSGPFLHSRIKLTVILSFPYYLRSSVLPRFFKHGKFSSFIRQLNMCSFLLPSSLFSPFSRSSLPRLPARKI